MESRILFFPLPASHPSGDAVAPNWLVLHPWGGDCGGLLWAKGTFSPYLGVIFHCAEGEGSIRTCISNASSCGPVLCNLHLRKGLGFCHFHMHPRPNLPTPNPVNPLFCPPCLVTTHPASPINLPVSVGPPGSSGTFGKTPAFLPALR